MKIKTYKPQPIWKLNCTLGEGTLWVKEHNSIYFVDIKRKKIFSLNLRTKKKKTFKVNKEIGFLSHVKKDIFILGLQGEIRIQNLKSKKIINTIPIESDIKFNRINDGKTDPIGNLWFGTMDNLERKIEKGSLYKLDKNLNLKKIDKNYRITNGPAFIDQYNFYHTDSSKNKIYKIKIDKKNKIQSKKIFKIFSKKDGSPDGMTLDSKKNLWVAHFHGACVSVFNNKAKLIHRIHFAAKNITNCTFGGLNNNELFVTSATKGMNSAELRKYRYSGSLFSVKTNSKGLLQKKFILVDEKKRSLL